MFSWKTNIWKGLLPGMWGVVASLVATKVAQYQETGTVEFTPEESELVISVGTGVILYLVGAFNNWRKNDPRAPIWIRDLWGLWPVALVLVIGAGCQTVQSEMTANGDSYTYSTKVTAGPFGKLDARAATFSAGVDESGAWHVDTGDAVEGIDNTGQIKALRETIGLIGTIAPLFARPAPVAEPEPAKEPLLEPVE